MADLYGTTVTSSLVQSVAPESEEISTFLNQFLHHNSSSASSSSSCMAYTSKYMYSQPSNAQTQSMFLKAAGSENRSESECRAVRDGNSGVAIEPSYGVVFSDPGADMKESNENTSENNLGYFSCDSEVLLKFSILFFTNFCLVAEKIGGERNRDFLFYFILWVK